MAAFGRSLNIDYEKTYDTYRGAGELADSYENKRKELKAEDLADEANERDRQKARMLELDEQQKLSDKYRVKADSPNKSLNEVIQNTSQEVVEKAADIRRGVASGDIDPADASKQLTALTGTIDLIKGGKEWIQNQQTTFKAYQTGGKIDFDGDGEVDAAVDKMTPVKALATMRGLSDGSITMGLNDDGELGYMGVDGEGEEIPFTAIGDEGLLPGMIQEQEHYSTPLKAAAKELSSNRKELTKNGDISTTGNPWDETAQEYYNGVVDGLLSTPDKILSQAGQLSPEDLGLPKGTDIYTWSYGKDGEDGALNTPTEDGGSLLKQRVEAALMKKAELLHINNEIEKIDPQATLRIQQQKANISAAKLTTSRAPKPEDVDKVFNYQDYISRSNKTFEQNAEITDPELQNWNALSGAGGIGDIRYDEDRELQVLYPRDGDPFPLDPDPVVAKQQIDQYSGFDAATAKRADTNKGQQPKDTDTSKYNFDI